MEQIFGCTDEIYETCEKLKDSFGEVIRQLVAEEFVDAQFDLAELKDPVRIHEKATDKYAGRFKGGLPEACVTDVIRSRIVSQKAEDLLKMASLLMKGLRCDKDEKIYTRFS